jgi:hypothetical protein
MESTKPSKLEWRVMEYFTCTTGLFSLSLSLNLVRISILSRDKKSMENNP